MSAPIRVDVLIIGAGSAGLWCARRLIADGYSVIVLENVGVGGGQTAVSQGILHAGIKYALTGRASGASRSAASGAERWAEALNGHGKVDLRNAGTLSDDMFLWSTGDAAAGLVLGAAVMAIRSGVRKLAPEQRPTWLSATDGPVYKVTERVVSTPAVVRELARGVPIVAVRSIESINRSAERTSVAAVAASGVEGEFIARRVVACAGAGNESILHLIGVGVPGIAQRRPLAMVLARGAPEPIFGHCISTSTVPRLTITSGWTPDGVCCWWIGGQIAERGATMGDAEVIASARTDLAECTGSLDSSHVALEVVREDRAEGFDERGKRPDSVVVRDFAGVTLCWPTKLVLTPMLAEEVASLVRAGVVPSVPHADAEASCADLPPPPFARTPWEGAP